jgi:TPR repeat protein
LIYFDAKEYGKARETFLIGAERDFAPSMHMLAMLYVRGDGVPVDTAKARDLLERGVAQGHIFSKRNLGALLMRGRFGAWQIVRGMFLFLTGFSDAVIVIFRDPHSDRLR